MSFLHSYRPAYSKAVSHSTTETSKTLRSKVCQKCNKLLENFLSKVDHKQMVRSNRKWTVELKFPLSHRLQTLDLIPQLCQLKIKIIVIEWFQTARYNHSFSHFSDSNDLEIKICILVSILRRDAHNGYLVWNALLQSKTKKNLTILRCSNFLILCIFIFSLSFTL